VGAYWVWRCTVIPRYSVCCEHFILELGWEVMGSGMLVNAVCCVLEGDG
jgi:hypothetical protein